MFSYLDFEIVKFHKSKSYILWPDINLELSILKKSFINSIKKSFHYVLEDKTYNIIKEIIPNVINLNDNDKKINFIDYEDLISNNNISQILISIESSISGISSKYCNNKENTLFWNIDSNSINIINNHKGNKWIFFDSLYEKLTKKKINLLNLINCNVENFLCINLKVYLNIINFFENVILINYFDNNLDKINLIKDKKILSYNDNAKKQESQIILNDTNKKQNSEKILDNIRSQTNKSNLVKKK
jgi:hypothetical protein